MSRKSKRQIRRGKHQPPASGREPSVRLTQRDVEASADELVAFHHLFEPLFQRREQRQWSAFYLCGQLANLERKTIEGMVLALKGPDRNAIRGLQQFIGQGRWRAETILGQHQDLVAEWFGEPDGVVIVDGSGFPKRGPYSAGAAPQYCGHLGKVANCQQGVFLVYASSRGYTFLDERLYVPEGWFGENDRERWHRCGIPEDLRFQTEPELGREMIGDLVSRGVVPFRWVTADEHYGENPAFLDEISKLGKWYLVEVPAKTRVWLRTPAVEPPGRGLLGRPRTRPRVARNAPRSREVCELAEGLSKSQWTRRIIKEGSKGPLVAEFAFLRATTIRDGLPGPRIWVVFRHTLGRQPELKVYFSNAPTTCPRSEFIRVSGLRWPVETALEEGKGELGMDHYETRSWQGWHHHMAQTLQAHLFLMRLRLSFQKKPGADHGASASVSSSSHRERQRPPARYFGDCPLPSTAKLCRLSFAPQAHTQAPSPAASRAAKTQSLVVVRSLVVVLARRNIPHGPPLLVFGIRFDGFKGKLWTTSILGGLLGGSSKPVYLGQTFGGHSPVNITLGKWMSRITSQRWAEPLILKAFAESMIYLTEYTHDVAQFRARGLAELKARQGGPLGVEAVKEIVVSVKDFEEKQAHWQSLLAPAPPTEAGLWELGNGPAIRLERDTHDHIQALVLKITSLEKAKTCLAEKGLLGRVSDRYITIDPMKVQGLDIRLME